jgi:predicted ABC-type ATPase
MARKPGASSRTASSESKASSLAEAVGWIEAAQKQSQKPLAIVLAGHNGSGKSTMWYKHLAPLLKIPLINADRMMLSVLPERGQDQRLPSWAEALRDKDEAWMKVAQQGVESFTVHAMVNRVPFAMETVFSYWKKQSDGSYASKIDRIRDMQKEGYFVVLLFVGLSNADLSVMRVQTRVAEGGHAVDTAKLYSRFPRTQKAIAQALSVTDAAILVDNSRDQKRAFRVCRVQLGTDPIYDWRDSHLGPPAAILAWLDKVAKRPETSKSRKK